MEDFHKAMQSYYEWYSGNMDTLNVINHMHIIKCLYGLVLGGILKISLSKIEHNIITVLYKDYHEHLSNKK